MWDMSESMKILSWFSYWCTKSYKFLHKRWSFYKAYTTFISITLHSLLSFIFISSRTYFHWIFEGEEILVVDAYHTGLNTCLLLQRGKHAKIFYFKGEQRSRQADENPYENCDWERKKSRLHLLTCKILFEKNALTAFFFCTDTIKIKLFLPTD